MPSFPFYFLSRASYLRKHKGALDTALLFTDAARVTVIALLLVGAIVCIGACGTFEMQLASPL